MDKIISVFRPWLATIPTVDIVPTKLGWIIVQAEPLWVNAAPVSTEEDLLEALVIQFIEQIGGDRHSREDAQLARKAMSPYLAQLTPDQVLRVDQALEVYARLDEFNPSRQPESPPRQTQRSPLPG